MASARDHMLDLLVEHSIERCREDDRYLFSLVRAYWETMDDAQVAHAYANLSPADNEDIEPEDADPASERGAQPVDTVELRVIPQAWINDQAVPVDNDEPDTWLVPLTYLLEHFPTEDDWTRNGSARDEMIWSDVVPRWVREWKGPFEIEIAPGEASPWDRKSEAAAVQAFDVHVYATIRVKVHVLAPDHRRAMDKADEILSGNGFGVLLIPNATDILDAEYAEEVSGYLVDQADDTGFLRSRSYDADHEPRESRP